MGGTNDGVVDFHILDDILISDSNDPLRAIVDSMYPNLIEDARGAKYLEQRAILFLTLEVVDKVNDYVMSTWLGEEVCYLGSHKYANSSSNEDIYTLDFLNGIFASGLPNHKLTLKVDVPVILL